MRQTRSRPPSFRAAIVLVFGGLAAFAGAPTAIADPPEPPAWAYPLNPATALRRDDQDENLATIRMRTPMGVVRREGVARP